MVSKGLAIVLLLASVASSEASRWDFCSLQNVIPAYETLTRAGDEARVAFNGYFELAEGFYQPLNFDTVTVSNQTNGDKTLRLGFDCGQISIEMKKDPASDSYRSGKILASGDRADGLQFTCQLPDSNGLIQVSKMEPFVMPNGFVIECVDQQNQKTGEQIVVYQMFVDLYFKGFFDHCVVSPNMYIPKIQRRGRNSTTFVIFGGQYKLPQGYYQRLNFDKVSVENLPNKKIVKLEFDCGIMSIEFLDSDADNKFRSGKIVAHGERTDGMEFKCEAPTNGSMQLDKDTPYQDRGLTFDCLDADNNKTGGQILIDDFVVDLFATSSLKSE